MAKKADKKVVIYSTPTCPICKRAKAYLAKKGVGYKNIDVSASEEAAHEMIHRSGQMGTPVIFVGLDAIVVKTMKKKNNVIFIAKTSNTKKQFEKFGSLAGDIFYYNHITNSPGFSKLFVEKKYGQDKTIASTFVRLSESTPIIKLEFLGEDHSESEIKTVLNKLYKNSVGGYPYALKLAHNNCKISDKELSKMVSLLGLSNEIGSREVLG